LNITIKEVSDDEKDYDGLKSPQSSNQNGLPLRDRTKT